MRVPKRSISRYIDIKWYSLHSQIIRHTAKIVEEKFVNRVTMLSGDLLGIHLYDIKL